MSVSSSRSAESVDWITECPSTFCDDLGALPRKGIAEQQREAIFSLARQVFYAPRSFLQSPSLRQHQLVALMAVTQDPELVLEAGLTRVFREDPAVLRTALIAAKRLRKESLCAQILELNPDPSLRVLNEELQYPLSLTRLWAIQVKENPQLYPLLPFWCQDDEEIMSVALQGDGHNVQHLTGGNRGRLDLVRIAMKQYHEAWRLAPLGIQMQIR
jgi:hypothetical protein